MILRTQGVVLALTGGVCARLALTDVHLRYVNGWMRWPLLLTAVVLLVLAVRVVVLAGREQDAEAHRAERAPLAAWLLLAPVVAVFVISPPALGAYTAERNAVAVATDQDWDAVDDSGPDGTPMPLGEFQSRAQWDDSLAGRPVELVGFVTRAEDGDGWVLNRLAMSCCAADVVGYQVRVEGAPSPPVESWVRVSGEWVDPQTDELPRPGLPRVAASDVRPEQEPAQSYE